MLQELEAKLKEISSQLDKSIANHNFLLGAKASLEAVYNSMVAAAPTAEAIVAVADPAAAPVVDAAVSTVEGTVNAVDAAV